MKTINHFILITSICTLTTTAFGQTDFGNSENQELSPPVKTTLTIGRVSHNPKKHYRRMTPIVSYVSNLLGDFGIDEGDVTLASGNQKMIYYLKKGKVDWVTETIFSGLLFCEKTGAEIILKKWKKGNPDYYSVFITKKGNDINTLADLKGKVIGFNDSGSTTSYFLPMAILKKQGLEMEFLYSSEDKPAAGKVGYIFTGGDELNVASWLHIGLVDAAAFSNEDWQDEGDTPPVLKKKLRIFHQSKPMPRALEIIGGHVTSDVKQKIKEILLEIHKDPKSQNTLLDYDDTKKFTEISVADQMAIEEAKKMLEYIRNEVVIGL